MAATLHLEVGIGNFNRLVKVLVRQTGHHGTHLLLADRIGSADALSRNDEHASAFGYGDVCELGNVLYTLADDVAADGAVDEERID